jgi:hypothetical protein
MTHQTMAAQMKCSAKILILAWPRALPRANLTCLRNAILLSVPQRLVLSPILIVVYVQNQVKRKKRNLKIILLSFKPWSCQDSQHSISKSRVNHSYGSLGKPMSKSSDNHKPTSGSSSKRRVNKSDQDRIYQNLFWVHGCNELSTESSLHLCYVKYFYACGLVYGPPIQVSAI